MLTFIFLMVMAVGCNKNPIAGGSGTSRVSISPNSTLNLPGPFNITNIRSDRGSIDILWSKSRGADYYIYKYKLITDADFTDRTEVTTTSDSLNPVVDNLTYEVKIVAVNSMGIRESNVMTIVPTNADSAPIAADITPTGIAEDAQGLIQLQYSDVDGDLATNCAISSPTNVTITQACSCNIGGFCTVGVTGPANYNGSASFQYTVTTFGKVSNLAMANFTIAPVNDAPTIAAITNKTTNEDTSTSAIAFTIADIDSTLTCAGSVTGTSSNTSIVANSGIVISGTAPNCTAVVTPVANANGAASITLTVSDGALSAASTFTLTVTPVNDAPTVSAVIDQSTFESTATGSIAFTIYDIDNTLSCATSVSATSSNTSIVANAGITFGGTAPNCIVILNPVASANGNSNITITATDGALTSSSTFKITVLPINDAPTMGTISAKTTVEDMALPVAFTINDIDSTLTCTGSVTGVSSNQTIVPNGNISFSGTYPNCIATVNPAANANGSVNITLTVSDTQLTATRTFTLNVTAVNDAPTINTVASQSTNEDTVKSGIPVTISDIDSALTCVTSVTASSSNTAVVSNLGISVTGTYPNCLVSVTPIANANGLTNITLNVSDGALSAQTSFAFTVNPINDAPTISAITSKSTNEDVATTPIAFTIGDIDSTLTCAGSVTGSSSNTSLVTSGGIAIGGTFPNCTATITPLSTANGSTTITLTVSDGLLTSTSSFNLTVNAINNAPTFAFVSNATTNEDTPVTVNLTISDIDSSPSMTCSNTNISVVSSSNAVLIPAVIGSDLVIGGTYPNCTATFTPAANQNGAANIVLKVTDNGMPLPALSTNSNAFTISVNALNDAPTIGSIAAQTTTEDTSKTGIAFTIGDIDSTLTCTGSVTGSSSNQSLIANSGITVTGTYPNCILALSPVANANGSASITMTVSDGALTAAQNFTFTLTPVNDAPTISTIVAQSTNEGAVKSGIAFTINDIDSTLTTCSNYVTGSSSNTTLLSNSNIIVSGTYPNCSIALTPTPYMNGVSNVTMTVTDGFLSNATTFVLTVNAVNDAPTISSVSNQSVAQNATTSPIAFTINDIDSTLTCASVSASSSNIAKLANSGIVLGGTFPNCTVTLTPVTNSNGSANVTLTVSDGSLTSSTTFTLFIAFVNQAPTMSAISAQTTNEDTVKSGVAFTISDVDSALTCASSVTGTSSNTSVVAASGIVVSGTAPNCTVTLTPVANASGTTNISLTVSDGFLSATQTFALTVNAVNDAPSIGAIATQATNEDTTSSPIAFTINDIDSTIDCSTAVTKSSSNVSIVASAGITIGGTYPNCIATVAPVANANGASTITLTVSDGALTNSSSFTMNVNAVNDAPAISTVIAQSTNEDTAKSGIAVTINDIDNSLVCSTALTGSSSDTSVLAASGISVTGSAPNCIVSLTPVANANGSTTVTLSVSDGALNSSTSFVLTVNAVNDAPIFGFISNYLTNEDSPVTVNLTINDIDSSPSMTCSNTNISVVSSSNAVLIPAVIGSDLVIGGTYPNCTATFTPAANQNGAATIVLKLTDNGMPLPALSTNSNAFTISVNAVNDAPTIGAIANQNTDEDTAKTGIPVTIGDIDSTLVCSTALSGTSSNTAIVANASIVASGTYPNCTISVTPVANANGTATITMTVSDGSLNAQSSFYITVNPVNDAPTIGAMASQSTDEDTTSSAIAFTIGDIDSTLTCAGSVTGSSSNTSLVTSGGIAIGGTFPNCTVTITPVPAANGSTSITLSVSDGSLSASRTFTMTINAVNDAPTIGTVASQSTNEDTVKSGIPVTISDIDSALTCVTSVTASSSNTSVVGNLGISVTGTYPNCLVSVTPIANANGLTNITLNVSDGALSAQTAFAFTVNPINDAPTISAITSKSTNEDVATTPIAFTIGDIDSTLTCAGSVTGSSSNTSLVTSGGIAIGGTFPNCTATITPLSTANGSTTITLTVSDGLLTSTSSFALTVNAVNNAPTIGLVTAQSTNEDTILSNVAFTIGDIDSALTCATSVTATSSNTAVVGNLGINITGTYPNCLVSVTPIANANGLTNITLNVSDGALFAQRTFAVTFNPVNDAPTIGTVADRSMDESTTLSGVTFTINDIDSTLTCAGAVSASSSNTVVLPNNSFTITGTYPNCSLSITPPANFNGTSIVTLTVNDGTLSNSTSFVLTINPVNVAPAIAAITNQTTNEDTAINVSVTADDNDSLLNCATSLTASSSDTTLIANNRITFSGTIPNCTMNLNPNADAFGVANITVTVSDGSLSNLSNFQLTVNPVNDAPTITISGTSPLSFNEDTPLTNFTFTVADVDSPVDCTAVTIVSSSNMALLDTASLAVSGDTGTTCTLDAMPSADASGTSTITLSVTDGTLTTNKAFILTVNPVNDPPVINPTAITNLLLNTSTTSSTMAFTISDLESTVNCTNVTATSSDTARIPTANIVIAGSGTNCTVKVTSNTYTTTTDVTVTLTLTDLGTPMPAKTATTSFLVTVVSPASPLTIGGALKLSGVASPKTGNTYARTTVFNGLAINKAVNSVEVCLSRDINSNQTLDTGNALEMCNVQNWLQVASVIGVGAGSSTPSAWKDFQIKDGVNGAAFTTGESPLFKTCPGTANFYFISVRLKTSTNETAMISTSAWTFWDPTCLGTTALAMWLDASDSTSYTLATGKVSAWNDKSGNARNFLQATATKQPTFTAAGMGAATGTASALPGVTFSASTTYLLGTSFAYAFGSASYMTVLNAVKPTAATNYFFSEGNTSTSTSLKGYYAPITITSTPSLIPKLVNDTGTTTTMPTSTAQFVSTTTTAAKKIGYLEDTGTAITGYSFGVAATSSVPSYVRPASATFTTAAIGTRFRSNAVSTSGFTGNIGELFVLKGILSTADRQKLEGYAAHKWLTNTSLQTNHPYYNSPP